MDGDPGLEKFRDEFRVRVRLFDPVSNANFTNWHDIEEARAIVEHELRKPEPQLVFVPKYLAGWHYLGNDRVVVTHTRGECAKYQRPIYELAVDVDGVRFGRSGLYGAFLPYQAGAGDYITIYLRKSGKGSGSKWPSDDKLIEGLVEDDIDIMGANFESAWYRKRGGVATYVDQFGFKEDGGLAEAVCELSGFDVNMSLEGLKALLDPFREDNQYVLPTGVLTIAWIVKRKQTPVCKQSLLSVLRVEEQVIPGLYYPFVAGADVVHTKPSNEPGDTKGWRRAVRRLFGVTTPTPATPVTHVNGCTECGYVGWLPLKDTASTICGCGCVYSLQSPFVDAESAGRVGNGVVLALKTGANHRVVVLDRTYYVFGGALWACVGSHGDVDLYVPRVYSNLISNHMGVVGTGLVNEINSFLVDCYINGIKLSGQFTEGVLALYTAAGGVVGEASKLTWRAVRQAVQKFGFKEGVCEIPTSLFHPLVVGYGFAHTSVVHYASATQRSWASAKQLVAEARALSFNCFGLDIHTLANQMAWLSCQVKNSSYVAYVNMCVYVDNIKCLVEKYAGVVGAAVRSCLEWFVNHLVIARTHVVAAVQAISALLHNEYVLLSDEFRFLCSELNVMFASLCKVLHAIFNQCKTSVKWAGARVQGFQLSQLCFYTHEGKFTESSVPLTELNLSVPSNLVNATVDILEGEASIRVKLDSEIEVHQGTLEEIFDVTIPEQIVGHCVVLANKLFVNTPDGYYYRLVKGGGIFQRVFKLKGGGDPPKVSFGQEEVVEIPATYSVTFRYDVHPELNELLAKLMPSFDVDVDVDLSSLAIQVRDHLVVILRDLFSDCPVDVRPLDIEDLANTEVFIYDMDYEKVLSHTMWFSLEDAIPEDDCETVCEDDDALSVASSDASWLDQELVPEGYKRLSDYVYIKCADLIEEARLAQPEVLVNAANIHLNHGGGVAGALNRCTNGDLQRESTIFIKQHGPLKVAESVLLSPFGLATRGILHVVGPDKRKQQPSLLLEDAYSNYNEYSVVMSPILSAGIFGHDPVVSVKAAIKCVKVMTLFVVNDRNVYDKVVNAFVDWAEAVDAQERKCVTLDDVAAIPLPPSPEPVEVEQPVAVSDEVVSIVSGDVTSVTPFKAVAASLKAMIQMGKEQNLLTVLVLGYKPFARTISRCNPQVGFYEHNGQSFYGYHRDANVEDVIRDLNTSDKPLIMLPIGYITTATPMSISALNMRNLKVQHTVVFSSVESISTYQGFYFNAAGVEETAALDFVRDIVVNGLQDWTVVQRMISCDGRCFKTFAVYKDVQLCYDSDHLYGLVGNNTMQRFATVSQCRAFIERQVKPVESLIKVLVTVDGVNYSTVCVSLGQTFGQQIGSVTRNGVDVTTEHPTQEDDGCSFVKRDNYTTEEEKAICAYYGSSDTNVISTITDLTSLVSDWRYSIVDGKVCLHQQANNCYLNVVLLMVQHMKLTFNIPWLQHCYTTLLGGDPRPMVVAVMTLAGCKYGESDDAGRALALVLRHAVVEGKRVVTTVCDACGTTECVYNGVDACVYYGALTIEDMCALQDVRCSCGRTAQSFVSSLHVPFMFMSANPTNMPLQADGAWFAANIFKGPIDGGHYLHAVNGSLIAVHDAHTRKQASLLQAPVADMLYMDVNFVSKHEIVTYTLDGIRHTGVNVDLSKYFRRGDRYFTTKPLDVTAAPKFNTPYDNFSIECVDKDLAAAFNKAIGFDATKSTVVKLATILPDASGDIVVADSDGVPQFPAGTLFQGKPILFRDVPNSWKRLIPLLSVENLQLRNRYSSLTTSDVVVADTSPPIISPPAPTRRLYGLRKSMTLGGVIYEPGVKGDILCIDELTLVDIQTFYVEGCLPFVLLKPNTLSKCLGCKCSTLEVLHLNELSMLAVTSVCATLKCAELSKNCVKTGAKKGCRFFVNRITRANLGVRCYNVFLLMWRLVVYLASCVRKPKAFTISSVVMYNTGCALTTCLHNWCCTRFNQRWLQRTLLFCKMLLWLWFIILYTLVLTVWLADMYTFDIIRVTKHFIGYNTTCDLYLAGVNGSGFYYDMCMHGMDNYNYASLKIHQDRIFNGVIIPWTLVVEWCLAYLLYTPLFSGLVGVAALKFFLSLYVVSDVVAQPLFVYNNWILVICYYALHIIPMSVMLRLYILMVGLFQLFKCLSHVRYGCNNVSCLMCYKNNAATRVECSTIVCGTKRNFYVYANGGVGFCSKHNWNCLNCGTYDVGSTFISGEIATELSNQFKRTIVPTDRASYDVTSVSVRNGSVLCYYEKDGVSVYDRFPMSQFANLTRLYYSELKPTGPNINVIVYDGTNKVEENAVRNSAVYYAQLACKPMLLVDKRLVGVVGDDATVSKTLFETYATNFLTKFNLSVDKFKSVYTSALQQIASGTPVDKVLRVFVGTLRAEVSDIESDVDTADLVGCIQLCHNENYEWVLGGWNNLLPTYIKQETLSTLDLGTLITVGARYINGNIAKNVNVALVWRYADFVKLSDGLKRQLRVAARKTGLSLVLTTSTLSAKVPCVTTPCRLAGGYKWSWPRINWTVVLQYGVLFLAILNFCMFLPQYSLTKEQYPVADFKVIDQAVIRDISATDTCFANKFASFDSWYGNRFGVSYTNDHRCPMVVGVVAGVVGDLVPGLPTRFLRVQRSLLPLLSYTWAADSLCYTPFSAITYTNFADTACVLSAMCTVFASGMNEPMVSCFDPNMVNGSVPYSQLQPHVMYPLYETNGYIRFPEFLWDVGLQVTQLQAMEYCRVDHCAISKAGVCLSFKQGWLVYNDFYQSKPGVYCGETLLGALFNILLGMFSPIGAIDLTTSVLVGALVALIFTIVCYYGIKFRRAYGDYSTVVFMCVFTFILNTVVLCISTAVPMVAGLYSILYLYVTCYFTSDVSLLMHIMWIIMYFTVVPYWMVIVYLMVLLFRHSYWLYQTFFKRHITVGELTFHSFADAALQTFLIDKNTYLRLRRELSADQFTRYLNLFTKYKYFTGSMDTSVYREAACAHLVKALDSFSNNGGDLLYQPPRCSLAAAALQSGLVRMAHPSGAVEPCVVKVSYGNMTLNGLWLDNNVFCPRHVLCSRDDMVNPDYERLCIRAANHDIAVSFKNTPLRVVSHQMVGALLKLGVDVSNPNTPPYSFGRLTSGQSFSILACYDGMPSGVYTCTLRDNGCIAGSFLSGSCGSPGFVRKGKEIMLCYIHQLELPCGRHTGTDLEGKFYGTFEDKQSVQLLNPDVTLTVNVLAWLYAAVISGERWFVTRSSISIQEFNVLASRYMYQPLTSEMASLLEPLVAKTGISVETMLASLKNLLSVGLGGRLILGSGTLDDEHTPHDVVQQMLGVKLQGKIRSCFTWGLQWMLIAFVLFTIFYLHLIRWTVLNALPFSVIGAFIIFLAGASAFLALLIKHKHCFLTVYLLPVVMVAAYSNLIFVPEVPYQWLLKVYTWLVPNALPLSGLDMATMLFVAIVSIFLGLRIVHSDAGSRIWYVCTACCWLYTCFVASREAIVLSYLTFVVSIFTNYAGVACLSLYAARFMVFLITLLDPATVQLAGYLRCVLVAYLVIGFCCTCYWGVFNLLHSIFRVSLGVYDYRVSPQELRYMNSQGLQAPTNSMQALLLNLKLLGIGGPPVFKIASLQSKLSDLKCTSVVLLGVLQQLRIEASSRMWTTCVSLHNDILAATTPQEAFESFASLLSVLLSLPGAVNLEELCNSILDNPATLQAVASEFSNLGSFVDLENAQASYDNAIATGASPQTIKVLKKALNIAKAAYDKDVALTRRLERMSEQAMTQMYKQARADDKRSKVTASLQTMLFCMIKRLDNDALTSILTSARNGVVPLCAIPRTAANKLVVVVPDINLYQEVVEYPVMSYAGVAWDIQQLTDADGKAVNASDITRDNACSLAWPLLVSASRQQAVSPVKLQNNELVPQSVRRMTVAAGVNPSACNVDCIAYYNCVNNGGRLVMAILADCDGLTCARVDKSTGDGFVTLELEPSCKFMAETPKGPKLKYLYFTKGLKNIHRGTVLGAIACTVRLHAGSVTEVSTNASILSLCAFSVDPEVTYKEFVDNGGPPIGNCVKMLTPHTGTGLAISTKPDANMEQESFGGASCCIYCRCHIEHPTAGGVCKFKGKFVQIPIGGVSDPVGFCIRNTVCPVCGMWQGFGCPCASLREVNMQGHSDNLLNGSGVLVE
ncbi:ORF1a [Pteropus rufus nobecovirus]|nr:ORF1a [Pteropus rufus nobecovirus]